VSVTFNNRHKNIPIPELTNISKWLLNTAKSEGYDLGRLTYTFLSDADLHQINLQFLDHDTFTDIITFDYNQGQLVMGEIYISLDRVKENAAINSQSFRMEFFRILIHGLLHLLGYHDKIDSDKKEMTAKEDYYLSLLPPN